MSKTTLQRSGPIRALKALRGQSVRLVGLFILASVILLQLSTQVADRSLLNRLDFIWYDWRLWLSTELSDKPAAGSMPSRNGDGTPIVIADIDEESLKREGRWPWSRATLAQLTERLYEAGASVVAFDIVFAEPEESAFLAWLDNQPSSVGGIDSAKALRERWNPDRRLAEALSNRDTVLGFFFQNDAGLRSGTLPRPVASLPSDGLQQSGIQTVLHSQPGYSASIPLIAESAGSGGFVTTYADADGVIRRTPVIMAHAGQIYPSLALAAAMSFLLLEDLDVRFAPIGNVLAVSSIQLSDHPVHTDGLGRVLVPYQGSHKPFRYLPAWQVLQDKPGKLDIEGAVVLVGGSAIGLFDRVNTPLATSFPGVEVQASVLQGLLASEFPYRPAWQPGATFSQLLLTGLLLILIMPFRSPWSQAFWSLGTLAGWTVLNLGLWIKAGLDLPLASIFLLTLSLAAWFMFVGFVSENRSRRAVTNMFGQYVPAAHIDQMLSAPESYSMEGQNREMTVLFSDIRSFTTISEALSASELKALLNFYFTPITEIIFRHGGTIDKYVGDMVMAFWGAPLDDPQHRRNAILAAMEMIETTTRLRAELRARGLPEIQIGIGLNTGFMNVGDMGSEYRKAYTVLGDAVNLGSRLEGLTKFYGVDILVGPDTIQNVADMAFRFIDRLVVKGKNEPIDAFEPLGLRQNLDEAELAELERYTLAVSDYRTRRWDAAATKFQQLNEAAPARKIYRIYLERIEQLRTQDLPADWDGAYRHTSK